MVDWKFRSMTTCTLLLGLLIYLTGCGKQGLDFDASGTFEAKETIISAETAGKLLQFIPAEGTELAAGDTVGQVDCGQLALQKAQVEASKQALQAKTLNVQRKKKSHILHFCR